MNIFEQASRAALRFSTTKGQLTVEDLWSIPLTSETGKANLNDLAKGYYTELQKKDAAPDFVNPTAATTTNTEVQLRFDIVKHIIDVRVAENKAAATARARKEFDARIMAIIEQKQGDALGNKSIAELRELMEKGPEAMAAALG